MASVMLANKDAAQSSPQPWPLRPLGIMAAGARAFTDATGRWLALVALVATLLAVTFLWSRLATPFDGARLEPGEPAWRSDGVIVTPIGEQSGSLRAADVVVAVDGRALEAWAAELFQLSASRPILEPGQARAYTVLRGTERLELVVSQGPYPLMAVLAHHWGVILYLVTLQIGGLLLVLIRPRDRAVRLLFVIAWCGGTGGVAWWLGLQVSDLTGGLGFWHRAALRAVYMVGWIAVAHVALVFPRPQPLITRHPWVVWSLYLVPFALYAIYLASTRAAAASTLTWLGQWNSGERAVEVACGLLAGGAAVISYRDSRNDAIARQQWRWVGFGFGLSGLAFVFLGMVPEVLTRRALADWNLVFVFGLPIPVSLAVAVLRYHLFDINVVLNRALVYSGLTASVIGIYLVVVGYLGSLFRQVDDLPISLIATGVVAVLFQPLRERLQRSVNRLMYGERDEPYAVLSRLGRRLEATLAPEAVLPTVVETIAQALKLPYAAIALSAPGGPVVVAAQGRPTGTLLVLPVSYQGEPLGELRLASRTPGESFAAADRRLLEDVAHQAGIAAHAIRLTADLQRSRERLVTMREEERRRLRRDLHDGLGPSLASLTLKLDAAGNMVDRDPAQTKTLLAEVKRQTQGSIAEIRRLVYDLRPPALDELGLVSAIREHAGRTVDGSGLQVVVDVAEPLPALPAAVEVAAYRIVLEAVTNAVRHAAERAASSRSV